MNKYIDNGGVLEKIDFTDVLVQLLEADGKKKKLAHATIELKNSLTMW